MIARLLISKSLEERVEEIKKMVRSTILSEATPEAGEVEGSHTDFRSHPDVLYFPYDSKLGIAEARKIKGYFSLKPYSAKGRAVVLEDASNLTVEAQNALLKTLEEPPPNAILILGAPTEHTFLPTILSRCEIIKVSSDHYDKLEYHSKFEEDLPKLLDSTIEQRFEYIEKLKDREEFLNFLVAFFRKELLDPKITKRWTAVHPFVTELLQAEEWAEANVNIRAILEYLMLVMPSK